MAWVDYEKAYDTVPHAWIRSALRAVGAPRNLRRVIRSLIPKWRTKIGMDTTRGKRTFAVHFQRGLLQGDALSPLLFCLCLGPVSSMLRKCEGFVSDFQEDVLTHLLFMDDLK